MKVNFTKWGKVYHTPHLSFINNETCYQISFIILNYHWWIIINKKIK
jgi:hypothetical protein